MRKIILTAFLFSSLYAIALSQTPDSAYAKWLLTPEIKRGFDYALSAAKLTYKDFTFRTDYWEIDPARIREINILASQPLSLPFASDTLARSTKTSDLCYLLSILGNKAELHFELGDVAVRYFIGKDAELIARQARGFPSNQRLKNAKELKNYYSGLLALAKRVKFASTCSKSDVEFIQHNLPLAILENTEEEKLSVDELDSLQKMREKLIKDFIPLAEASRYVFEKCHAEGLFFDLVSAAPRLLKQFTNTTSDSIIYEDKKNKAIIGGTGPNHYKGDYALIIDLGGDDTYELARRPNFENQIIIDLGGNDKYYALEDNALASGNFGYSVLIDVSGDDLYEGKNFSLGCGFFGCGLLWDQAGNDTYIGDQFTEGAGGFGIGILKDDGGNDHYIAARAAQGFGFVRGVGALLDASGNDTYFAGGKYKEQIGLSGEIRYLSEAQGYATGLRPYLSGGMGFLFDYDGDDSYSVDMFGQGASYWWGLGALVDFKGNDRYVAQQYAQGAGVHMSLGCLVDSSGNDFYYSKGVSQGCGHDLGAGMLFDLSGNDTYVATDGSQAYGSANGIGVLVDGAGDDGYYVKDKKTTQGMGNPRREYGSIAVFLDCGGNDHYDGNGAENKIWKPTGTMWGVGVDGEFGTADSVKVKK